MLCGLLAWALGGTCAAAVAPPAALTIEVRELVQRLGSPRRIDREAAERRLLELGPPVLAVLPDLAVFRDPGVRESVRRIRTSLERRVAEESLQPSRVTWSGTATAVEIAAVISRQTGNPLIVPPSPDGTPAAQLTFDWSDRPFWEVVGELLTAGRYRLADAPRDAIAVERSIVLLPSPGEIDARGHAVAAVSGPFRWEITGVKRLPPPVDAGFPRLLRMTFRLRAEPRLRPLFIDYREADLRAAAGGRELQPFNPQASRQPDFSRSGTVEFSVDYLSNDADGDAPVQVVGRCEVEFAAAPQEVVFDRLDRPLPVTHRAGNVVVSLDRLVELTPPAEAPAMELATGRAAARLTLRYDVGGPVFESHRVATVHREVALHLPDGVRFPFNDGQELTFEQDGAIGALYRFRGLPPDWRQGKLLCEAPTAILRQAVGVEFPRVAVTDR